MIFSALWGSLAFLTRYNGAFIVIGSLLYIAAAPDFVRERLKRILLWTAVFVTVGLPWFIPNWIDTGSPVHNDNYMNVMMEYYALGKEGVSYENWIDALPKKFTGMGDIFFYDPVYFLIHMVHNTGEHFLADMKELLGWRLGLAVIVGFILFWFAAPDKKKLVYVSFGVMYFLILTLVFYNVRFSLYLLTCYLPLGVWPFTERKLTGRLKHFSWIPLSIIGFIVLSYVYTTPRIVLAEIKSTPSYLSDLRDLGCALDKIEPDKSKKIIGRKPHVAYFAGLEAVMFPENVTSVEDLVEFCRVNGIDYILYSGIEASLRPHVRVLLNVDQKHPGLEKVYHNRFGVIYRVIGLHKQ